MGRPIALSRSRCRERRLNKQTISHFFVPGVQHTMLIKLSTVTAPNISDAISSFAAEGCYKFVGKRPH